MHALHEYYFRCHFLRLADARRPFSPTARRRSLIAQRDRLFLPTAHAGDDGAHMLRFLFPKVPRHARAEPQLDIIIFIGTLYA